MLEVIDTRTKVTQILQLYYASSSRRAQSVGSFFGFQSGLARGTKAMGRGIGLIDLILSDLGHARSLGSFGSGVFACGALWE